MTKDKTKRPRAAASSPGQPPRLQVGALCWRRTAKGLRILLITSRDTGRWVIPKGWPMRNRTEAEAAAREAYEEAGLRGTVSSRSIGVYTYPKRLGPERWIPCVVRVYPLEAQEMLRVFPETGQRRTRWLAPEKAAQRVAEHELATIIREFDPEAQAEPA
ncbi:NUDIX hydrolase [Amaricoccus sp.]|uniref:NUDIX hydrolase n=1 Tax=Amaricoccus sp. TaxID=1872485 RepID=UPI00260D89ED|nr:NUDIX hydrolase [Amaricoccus sp.]HRO13032.1 NUDIX hydrolase [Amaricoccus sp.]